ncbi:SNF5-domain-containing protein [Gyrodon lividus]|nr:SNF5-domain-containing protein [Gyrodon lividus]
MNNYQQQHSISQQGQGQYPIRPPSSQQHQAMSFQGASMAMSMPANNLPVNGAAIIGMNTNPANPIGINMNGTSMGINHNNIPSNVANTMGSINPAYLAALQSAQHNQSSMSGMMGKFPSVYPSYGGQQGQSMNPSHSQISSMTPSQMHAIQTPQTPNHSSSQVQNQSISPTQLMSASPSQLMGGPSSQQVPSQSLTLTPAQLLQQQQGGSMSPASHMGAMNLNLASLGSIGGMNMNMGGMNNMQSMQSMGHMTNMNMSTGMNMQAIGHMGGAPNQVPNPNVRMNFPPGMNPSRYTQMSPQERVAFQRQQQAANMGHGLPTERAPHPGAPSQSAHDRGPSLTHERPPSQHDRAPSQTHERQPSQQPHDRAPSQSHDILALQGDRPSSSASVRSHHSHHTHEGAAAQHGVMPPPGSRPGTASGAMSQPPPRTHPNQHAMNLNPNMNAIPLMSSGGGPNINPNMNPHMNHAHAQQMNAGANLNLQLNPSANIHMGAGGGGMGMPMSRPPTRTGSALGHGSPKQSPRMGMGPMGGAPGGVGMSSGMGGVGGGTGMGGGMGGGMVPSMNSGNMGGMSGMGGPMNGNMGMGMGAQGMPGISGMGGMGSMNMNPTNPGGLGAGGNMMGGAGGGLMGPPVIPQSMQRPDREQMMQIHVRERSASVQRETSLPPSSTGPFMGQGHDGATVPNLATMGPNMAGVPRQSSQPPVHPQPPAHQQSPVRQLATAHRSPMPAVRKIAETPGPAGPSNVTPIPGTTPGQVLPPHLASLNPAVTKISYIPYIVPPKPAESIDGTSEEDRKPSADESTTAANDGSTESKLSSTKIEDSVSLLTPSEISVLKDLMAHDAAYETVYRAKQARMVQELRTTGPGSRLAWWDRDYTASMGVNRRPERFDVRYPRPQRNEGPRKKGARREGIRIPRKLPPELANRPEQLVPIRLEFDVEHHKMRETFVWNLNDPVITPEMFAQTLIEDYALAPSYHSVVTKSIQEQLSDFKAHVASVDAEWKPPSSTIEIAQSEGPRAAEQDDSGVEVIASRGQTASESNDTSRTVEKAGDDSIVVRGTLDEESVQWWESWRKRPRKDIPSRGVVSNNRRKKRKTGVKVEDSDDISVHDDKERRRTVDEFEMDEKNIHEDLRILIKLDIIVGSIKLDDQFEWDLDNQDASPEQFAEVYAKELGLAGEFKTAIAHCVREQVQVYQKSLFLVGHPADGSHVQDDDLRMSFLPSLASGTRAMDQVQSFTPLLNYLSDGEIERSEKEREKELTKRRKRNTRGRRGIALPDREPNRTYRTPAIGFPELDPATLALAAAANAPTSRRAAAAAASVTIANMVASENGTSIMPLLLPPQQSTSQIPLSLGKEKKLKGLLKPPTYPPSVLRPRAHVTAPTSSTAVNSTSMLPSSLLESDPPASIVSIAPPDSRAVAKKAREIERGAKEKEFADGQHANVINGVWHCSNCGCPESIAIGRRKGPLGDKSQCGMCGKFWHRHRRPRPVQYNSDPQYHLNIKNEVEQVKTSAKRRGRAPNSAVADGAETPSRQKSELWVEVASRPPNSSTIPPSEDDRPVSPASTASSGSEAPLAQQFFKNNGTTRAASAAPPRPSTPDSPRLQGNAMSPSEHGSVAPHSNGSYSIPGWLSAAIYTLQTKYPDDKFEAILRKPAPKATPEWRIKCLDCPGKLYNPGPGDSLSNYEVHLKNRQHRMRVNNRLHGSSS